LRGHTEKLPDVLRGSFSRRLIADVFHGSERVWENLPLLSWSLDGGLSREVKHQGRGTVAYNSVSGESLVPEGTEGILSPFRAKLLLLMEITAGGFTETVRLGWYRITEIPYAQDHFADVNGLRTVVGSVVDLVLQSLDVDPKRRGFRSEQQPPNLTSCYGELRRISGLPVIQTVPDRTIPATFVYEATAGGRLKAVQALAGILGGIATVDSAGALAIIPNAVGPVVGSLFIGAEGTVVDVPYSVTTDEVHNVVVGTYEDDERNPIFAVAEVTDGPLAISGDYGESTLYHSSPLVKTQDQANAAVAYELAQSSGTQNFDVPIQCIINPVWELGDSLDVQGHVRPLQGRLTSYSMSDSELMTVTLAVSRSL
jgi:hypothetical protein